MMNALPDDFEAQIQKLARAVHYPATPDLTTRAGLGRIIYQTAHKLRLQSMVRYAIAILVLLAAFAMLVPSVRAAVLDFLQIGGLRIHLQTPTPDLGSQILPGGPAPAGANPTLPSLFSTFNLAGETSLEQIIDAWGAPILLPGDSSTLGLPERVFLQRRNGTIAILLWTDPAGRGQLQASLIVMQPGAFLSKDPPELVRPCAGSRTRWAVAARGP